jgi:hypothetical protein
MAAMGWRLRQVLRWAGLIALIVVGTAVAEAIPLLHAPEALYAARPELKGALVALCGGLAGVGLLLLVGAQFVVRRPRPEELTPDALGEDVEAEFASTGHQPAGRFVADSRPWRGGPAVWRGSSFHVEAPVRSLKAAWRTGEWRANPVWRLGTLMGIGALLMTVGLFGLPIVLGPPFARLLAAGALAYAAVRTSWALYRA